MTHCPICSDCLPKADWSAHIGVHERAPMDERWSDAKDAPEAWLQRYLDEEPHDQHNHDDR